MTLDEILEIPDDYERVIQALQDDLFAGSDFEMAEMCGVTPAYARRVRLDLERSRAIRQMLTDAREAVRSLGLLEEPSAGDAAALVSKALREYVSRRTSDEAPEGGAGPRNCEARGRGRNSGSRKSAGAVNTNSPRVSGLEKSTAKVGQ